MQTVITVYTWLKANFADIAAIWVALIGAAEIIVKWTDSHRDNAVLGTIRAIGVKVISLLTKFGLEAAK